MNGVKGISENQPELYFYELESYIRKQYTPGEKWTFTINHSDMQKYNINESEVQAFIYDRMSDIVCDHFVAHDEMCNLRLVVRYRMRPKEG